MKERKRLGRHLPHTVKWRLISSSFNWSQLMCVVCMCVRLGVYAHSYIVRHDRLTWIACQELGVAGRGCIKMRECAIADFLTHLLPP